MIIYIGYTIEKCNRLDHINSCKLEYKFQKGHDILGTLLPGFVKERVKQGIRYIADYQSCVTILFCDIYEFDKICAMHTPNELLELLDRFFGILDQLCDKHGVTKIETVNKTYMVCGGLKDSEERLPSNLLAQHHSSRSLDLALEILQKTQLVFLKNGEKLHVKIGINTGPVIAGVVGEHKPQFSLVGDTVNTASRMCTTLVEADSIQITESSYKLLPSGKYKFKEETVFVKGKGLVRTFLVMPKGRRTRNRRHATIEKFSEETDPVLLERTSFESSQTFLKFDVSIEKFPESNKVNLYDVKFTQEEEGDLDLVGEIHWLICSFYESKAQKEFRTAVIYMNGRNVVTGMRVFTFYYFLVSGIFILNLYLNSKLHSIVIFFRLACIVLLLWNTIYLEKYFKFPMYPWFIVGLHSLVSFTINLSINILSENELSAVVLEKMY